MLQPRTRWKLRCSLLALTLSAQPVLAQTTSQQPPARSDTQVADPAGQNEAATDERAPGRAQGAPEETQAADIVVTAQGRTERLQQVPVSAQVLSGATLADRNINTLTNINQIAPSVVVNPGARSSNLYIRGIGSGPNQSFDQSVAIFVDDIYHGRSRVTTATFLDLDRVEILKGPQSTFFGNNAIAGAFNILTRKATDHLEGDARALIAPNGLSGGQFALEGAAGGPITDTVGFRVAATYNGQQGWLQNTNTNYRVPRERNLAGRLTVTYTSSDIFDVTLKVEGSRNRNRGGLFLQLSNCPPAAPFVARGFCSIALNTGVPIGLQDNRISANDGQHINLDTYETVLTAHAKLGDHVLTSVTGYYGYDFDFTVDTDATPQTLAQASVPEKYHQFSQEFRLASPTGKLLEYVAGIYFQDDRVRFTQDNNVSFLSAAVRGLAPFAPLVPYLPLGQRIQVFQKEDSYAAFASLTLNATDKLKLTGGLRATQVEKRFQQTITLGTATNQYGGTVSVPSNLIPLISLLGIGNAGTVGLLSRTDRALTPSARVQYQFDPRTMAYASYSRGFKAGGFNFAESTRNLANYPFDPEHVNAYEIGLKTQPLRGVVFNVAAFRSDFSNLQVSINRQTGATVATSVVRNAAASRSQGVEVEASWALSDVFNLNAAGTYLDAKYRNYANAGPTNAQSLVGILFQDLSGHRTPFAPEWSGSLTASVRIPLSDGVRLLGEVTPSYRSGYDARTADDPLQRQRPFTRLDARVGISALDGRLEFDVIGKNLTNRTIYLYPSDLPQSLGTEVIQKEQPRNFAAQVRYRF